MKNRLRELIPFLLFPFLCSTFVQAAEINLSTFEFCPSTSEYYALGGCPCLTSGTAGANVTETGADASVTVDAGGSTDNCTGTLYVCMDSSGAVNRDDCINDTNIDSRKTYATTGAETVTFTGGTTFTGLTQGTNYHTGVFFVPSGTSYDNRNSNADTAIAAFQTVASGGAGLETTNARFVGTGGNDSNDGLTHATRWLTENKVGTESATLPSGTDIYFLDDGDYGDGTEVTIAHDGDGLGDNVTLDTYCLDAGTTPIVYDSLDVDCGERAIVSGFHINGTDTSVAKIHQEDYVGGNQRKWNPGFYGLVKRNDCRSLTQQSTRWANWATAATDGATGVACYYEWRRLEGSSHQDYGSAANTTDSYGMGYLAGELEEAHRLGLKLWVRLEDQNDQAQAHTTRFPLYLVNGGFTVTSGNGSCTSDQKVVWKRWNTTAQGYMISLIQEIAENFDTHPALEGVTINKETAISNPTCAGGSGYTAAGNYNGYVALIDAAAAAFSNTNVVVNIADLYRSESQGDLETLMQYARDAGVGLGGPDLRPQCTGNDCATDPVTYEVAGSQEPAAYIELHDNSYEGVVPVVYSVESSELGNAAVSEFTGYTPAAFHDYSMDNLGVTHMLFNIKEFTNDPDTGSLEWCWSDATGCSGPVPEYTFVEDMLPLGIDAGNQACPSEYTVGCYSDED